MDNSQYLSESIRIKSDDIINSQLALSAGHNAVTEADRRFSVWEGGGETLHSVLETFLVDINTWLIWNSFYHFEYINYFNKQKD